MTSHSKKSVGMSVHIERFQRAMALIATAIGIFVPDLTALRAEALRQAGTPITIEMDKPKRLSPREVKDRGTKLRTELDKTFNALPDGEAAGHATEFTAIALPYISAGMALEDAEGILNAAGFTEPPGSNPREQQGRSRTDWYAVVAEIPQFAGRVFGPVEVFVMLLPPGQSLAEFAGRRHRMMYYARP